MQARRAAVIQQLFESMHGMLPYFDQPEEIQNRSYAQGKWTMREVLIHTSDTETVYLDRLRRVAAEDNPTLLNMDENLWAKNLYYPKRDLALSRLQFETARRSVIELARMMDESVDERAGTHSTAGRRTFAFLLASLPRHTAHHTEQLKAIVEGRTWTPK